jgi:uncharacterized protein (TIGR01777 family)
VKILITGATGFIGTALSERLKSSGHQIAVLTRSGPAPSENRFFWNLDTGEFDIRVLRDIDAVIHLAGENIGAKRWTPEQKRRIAGSRIKSTALLVDTISRLDHRPRVLISASAIGYYGNRGDELLTESSAPGVGFLSNLCREWEAEALKAAKPGLRVVCLRTGIVLSRSGGTLERMLPMFKFGLGGTFGSGNQHWSWIALDDAVRAVEFAVLNDRLTGPVNIVSPNPVTNAEFAKTLARHLHRPALFPVPAPILRLALGEMADSLILSSQRVEPKRLIDEGFEFSHSTLLSIFETVLN